MRSIVAIVLVGLFAAPPLRRSRSRSRHPAKGRATKPCPRRRRWSWSHRSRSCAAISAAASSNSCSASNRGRRPSCRRASTPTHRKARGVTPTRAQGRSRLEPQGTAIDPQFLRQRVDYQGSEQPGTIVIDTPSTSSIWSSPMARPCATASASAGRLHLVRRAHGLVNEGMAGLGAAEGNARAPAELPHFMAGGPNNPLGARALYLGSTLTRPRLERAMDDRPERLLRLHPHAQCGRHRSLRPREDRTKVVVL